MVDIVIIMVYKNSKYVVMLFNFLIWLSYYQFFNMDINSDTIGLVYHI